MNGPAPGPPLPELDRLVSGMETPSLRMHQALPGPPHRRPNPGLAGVALPEDLSGSEDLNNSLASHRQQPQIPDVQVWVC